MGRRHRLFPKASLVQVPPKDLCHHSKSVLLPCPPHRIAPLWEREFLPRNESRTSLKEQPSSTQLPLYPYARAVPTLPCLNHLTKNSKSLPYLKYQGITNASSSQHHINSSVFSLTNPEFRGRANASLRTTSKLVKPPFSSKHKVETPLVFERFPKISTSWNSQKKEPTHPKQQPSPLPLCENRSEELPQLKQKPSYLQLPDHKDEELPQHRQKPPTPPISNHQDEAIPLINCKSKTMGDPSTCPDSQVNDRPVPASLSHSAETPQNLKNNIRVLTVMVSREGTNLWPKCLILQSPHSDHHHSLEEAPDIDYMNQVTKHALEETALPFLKGNQQSGPCTLPSSLPKYVNRGTSTDFPWPPFNVMVANITSSDPNHQARVIMRQLRGFTPSTKSVSDSYLSLGAWRTSGSFPFAEHIAEASPGSDYKAEDTTGLPLHSKHKVTIPPLGVDHFSKVAPDLSPQTAIPMGSEHRTSTSVVLSDGPEAAPGSKTQDVKTLSPPISQTEYLLYSGLLDKDSLALESKFRGPIDLGQKVETSICSDNQVSSSLYPNQQAQVIQSPDCQNVVTLSPDDYVQYLNIFDLQKKETLVPILQNDLELGGPSHYQTQIVPDSYEMILLLSDKTKAIPPLSHDHTTEPESQSKKATQPHDTKNQAVPQLCPDYEMVPPQTTEDHPREARPNTSEQVSHQTEVDFWKITPQEPDHQVITPPSQDNRETTSPGIDQEVITPPGKDDSKAPSLNIDSLVITPPGKDDSEVPSWNIDSLVITPPMQDDSEAPSLNIDNLVITPPGKDDSEAPSLNIDNLVITPPMQDDSEAPSLNIDNLVTTPPRKDDSEAPSLNIDNLVITPPMQDDSEAPSLNIDNLVITPPGKDDSEAPSLNIDNMVITPPMQDDSEAPSLNIDNMVTTLPGKDDSEAPSLNKDSLVITPPAKDDSEAPFLNIDNLVITPPMQDDSEAPSLNIDNLFITPPAKDDSEALSLNIDSLVITTPRQDDSETPSLNIDNLVITPLKQDDSETPWQDEAKTPSLVMDGQIITPPWEDDGGKYSPGIDCQVKTPPWQEDTEIPLQGITSPCQDDSETLSLGIDHQVITPPWQDDTETPSLGKECQVITPPCQDDDAAPSLGTDHQVITTLWQDNSKMSSLGIDHLIINPPWQDEGEIPSLGIDHQVITPPRQDDSETPSLDIEHQIITPPKQDEGEIPFLDINHQILTLPWEETSSLGIDHQVIILPWQDEGETPSLGIDDQIIIQPWQDDRESLSLVMDQQVIRPPWQDNSETHSLGTDHQTINTPWQDDVERPSLSLDHQVITLPWQDDSETPSLGLDCQVITLPWQDDNETPSLSLDHQVITLPWQDDSETPSLGLDCQVITLPWQEGNETPSLDLDHQFITPLCQDDGAVPSEGMQYQVITPPDSYHLTEAIPSTYLNLEAIVEPSEQALPQNYLYHGAKKSMRPEYQSTASLGQSNQVEIGSDANNNQSTFPTDQDDQVRVSIMPEEKTIPLSPPNSDYKNKTPLGLQNQTIQKREIPWHLKHIKPYTVEGSDNISARTVQAIVNSIPEEKIKNDICKQILFRRMKENTQQRPGKCMSTSYAVCLQCVSWVPNGCHHDKEMNHLFEAEMLVMPIPLPGSKEDMGLKFVLRVPHIPISLFNQFFQEPQNQCQLHSQLSNFPSPSQTALNESHVPAKAELLDYSKNDYTLEIKTSNNQEQLTKEMPIRRESKENEKSREHVKNFKSLLEKFQKQRQN
ncbi:uncharacterized protein LOC103101017 isoform X2 [Monodelphis domestica]|nr:uncharacterized protein LOC103101017 isoform X2 [Monodelphis domestica]XP_056649378.1 uncharacterized protein LOC103101017 isoform X2 [Monodelphis domestica]XP_056649379.1 uncharacterized protein LOC103101017 isoform X2 [Monodelphis domestica]XP_056649380.1 uncharacterized protein LOC103101017 isoform X2 [Monodelphis domestica]XP_056649381.1 uncharacterized protein LOC103101017 isoform X2 [Monodelphis domestica]